MFATRSLRFRNQLGQVARRALARPDVVAFGSVRSIAAVCSVSSISGTSLATALGFDSFRDFKLFFQQHLVS